MSDLKYNVESQTTWSTVIFEFIAVCKETGNTSAIEDVSFVVEGIEYTISYKGGIFFVDTHYDDTKMTAVGSGYETVVDAMTSLIEFIKNNKNEKK